MHDGLCRFMSIQKYTALVDDDIMEAMHYDTTEHRATLCARTQNSLFKKLTANFKELIFKSELELN